MKRTGTIRRASYLVIGALALGAISCEKLLPPAPADEEVLAGPVEGLTPEQLSMHAEGDGEFARVFAAAEGLGPIYVATSCEGCHLGDGKGHPLTTLTRFNRFDGTNYDPLIGLGGPQLQHFAVSGYTAEVIPGEATGVSKLLPPAVTGLGYLAAVSDADLLALADPNDANGDGISGVPNYVTPPDFFQPQPWHIPNGNQYIGRFGRKAAAVDLLQQTAGAYVNDMGITSDFLMQDLFNVQAGQQTGDNVPDPEVSAATVARTVFYIRTLKAPPRRNAEDADVKAGEILFTQTGCASCHAPTLHTGASDITALSNKTIHPYTDMLLHDMGPELDDGYTEGSALSAEWRTTPLWGLGLSKDSQGGHMFLMHDGRAATIEEAIELHGGEGSNSRTQFRNLSQQDKDKLIKFLESL